MINGYAGYISPIQDQIIYLEKEYGLTTLPLCGGIYRSYTSSGSLTYDVESGICRSSEGWCYVIDNNKVSEIYYEDDKDYPEFHYSEQAILWPVEKFLSQSFMADKYVSESGQCMFSKSDNGFTVVNAAGNTETYDLDKTLIFQVDYNGWYSDRQELTPDCGFVLCSRDVWNPVILSALNPNAEGYWDRYDFSSITLKGAFGGSAVWQAYAENGASGEVHQALSILEQPVDGKAAIGKKVTFSVSAAGESLTYQWQYQKVGRTTWVNSTSAGNKTDTLQVSATSKTNGYKFRCVITDADGHTETTESAILTALTGPEIIEQPKSVESVAGVPVSLTVAARGADITYQWQYQKPDSTSWKKSGLSSAASNTLRFTMSAGYDGMKFRCVVTDADGISTKSDTAVITLEEGLPIILQPKDATAPLGERAVFRIKVEGEGLIYQWQYQKVGKTNWINSGSSGNKTDTLRVKATTGTNGMKFRCVVTEADKIVAVSNAAVLTAE